MLFASSASNDCECTNTLAHKAERVLPAQAPRRGNVVCEANVGLHDL